MRGILSFIPLLFFIGVLEVTIIKIYFRIPIIWRIKKEEERRNANDIINYLLYNNTENNK